MGTSVSHSSSIEELGSLPEYRQFNFDLDNKQITMESMESLTALELNRAILSVVRKALELHVTQHDSFEPVVELHIPRLKDPDIGGVPCGPH